MTAFEEGLEQMLDELKKLRLQSIYTRSHILSNLSKFTPKELQCMAMDGIIEYKDIPDGMHTEHSLFMSTHSRDT